MDIRSRPLPQGPLLAASNRSKSTSGSAKFPTQFHLHCERHMLTTKARAAFEMVPRIEMTAFKDSGNLVHFEMGSWSYTKSRVIRQANDSRLRRSDPSSNDHTEKTSRNLLVLPFAGPRGVAGCVGRSGEIGASRSSSETGCTAGLGVLGNSSYDPCSAMVNNLSTSNNGRFGGEKAAFSQASRKYQVAAVGILMHHAKSRQAGSVSWQPLLTMFRKRLSRGTTLNTTGKRPVFCPYQLLQI